MTVLALVDQEIRHPGQDDDDDADDPAQQAAEGPPALQMSLVIGVRRRHR